MKIFVAYHFDQERRRPAGEPSNLDLVQMIRRFPDPLEL